MRHHPNDVHALVINRILALPKGSEAGNQAHRDYIATRLATRPKLLQQKTLLERSLAFGENLDAEVFRLDDEVAALWLELDSRIGWVGVATETAQVAPF